MKIMGRCLPSQSQLASFSGDVLGSRLTELRSDGVVLGAGERVGGTADGCEPFAGRVTASLVAAVVELRVDLQVGVGPCCGDEQETLKRIVAPIEAYEAERATTTLFHLLYLAGNGGRDRKADRVGDALQLVTPEADARTVSAAESA